MPHIPLAPDLPGIRGPFAFRPETAKPMAELAQVLLHDQSTMSRGDRELIATYVSSQNDCVYCQTSHGWLAAIHLGEDEEFLRKVKNDFTNAPITPKMKALLAIAGKVQRGGKSVLPEDVEHARQLGATDLEIHDTVLIAAAFCMYNRYVDGLATWAPDDMDGYRARAEVVARDGYMRAPLGIAVPKD
jgi:uncharacterized peroxidase-related enzyme